MQSIGNCVDRVEELIRDNPECFCLCLTEHWKTEEQLIRTGISDFKLASWFCRGEGQHGGSAIYIKESLKFKKMNNINKLSVRNDFECAAIECVVNGKKVIILCIYRPPSGNKDVFYSKLECMLSNVNNDSIIFMAGDFNIEMLQENVHKTFLFSLLNFYNMKGTVFENTRITKNTGSCLDNIFTNLEDNYYTNIVEMHISDHMTQILFFSLTENKNQFIYKRFFTEENKRHFLLSLSEQDWENVFQIERHNVNLQWDIFINTYIRIFNQHFPKTMVYINKKRPCSGIEVKECKNRLDTLLVLSRNNNLFKHMYNETKTEYDNLLKLEKTKLYEKKVKNSDNKNKCLWSICNEINGKAKGNNSHFSENSQKLVNDFNNHIINIVSEMVNNNPVIPFNCEIPDNNQSMYLQPVTNGELLDLVNKLKNKYSSGDDQIPTSIVKLSIAETVDVLNYIINNSLKFGIYPNQLKLAKIIPLYKKGSIDDLNNYRPISLLPSFSKIFELVMCSRLISFMNKCQLFSTSQHGYLKGKSTTTAIFQFTKAILDSIENKKLSLGMFIDLSKAYDCIDRDLLLYKLNKYGVRGNVYTWIKSYLSERTQRVVVHDNNNEIKSNIQSSNIGIAQGSILGPILFIIFLNDLSNITTDFKITNYADDTNLLVSGSNMKYLLENAENAFLLTSNWFAQNKLIINDDKTNLILFRTKQYQIEKPENILLCGKNYTISNNTTFLGITIEEFLSWNDHINKLCLKLSSIGYGIKLVSRYMNLNTLKILYHANFESVLRYGILFWGSSAELQRVFVIQKRILRVINRMNFLESCRGVFKKLNILTVYGLYIFECLMFVIKNRDKFENVHSNRNYNLLYPNHRLTITEKSPYYMCIKLYNKLPNNIKLINSVTKWKKNLKEKLIETEPYSLQDFFNKQW